MDKDNDTVKKFFPPGFIILVVSLVILFIGGAFFLDFLGKKGKFSLTDITRAEKISGLKFTRKEKKMMQDNLRSNLEDYEEIRKISLPNGIPPALHFYPLPSLYKPASAERNPTPVRESWNIPLSDSPESLAFAPVTKLAFLMKSRKITSLQLTKIYLERLKKYGPQLKCVITLTEEKALEQARRADKEMAAGIYRGPLHGIPWGAKDLLATKGIRTTWGAEPYKGQVFDMDATVVQRLEEAGAVLVAKLTMGALAMGDVWFGGRTRSPWNLERGSSGSSAGSASATAAGLVAFGIGTETWGSIVSPCTRCGTTGLRPTFGRVSRNGAMALSWSMDKIGPICRTVEDCALVFNAIYGPDGKDLTVMDLPFEWNPDLPVSKLRVGYLKKAFERDYRTKNHDQKSLDVVRSLGVKLIPLELPELPVRSLSFILNVEAAAAFDELTRSGRDDLLVRQEKGAWPNIFRQARFIPAVEYIQANRLRTLLMTQMAEKMKKLDVYMAPSFGGSNLLLTNLTGHPAVVVPNGFEKNGNPTSITFIGDLFEEAKVLRLAMAFQEATEFHQKHPPLK
ncbi:MAG: amidase [Candidatus Aminicenantes bacterium]|nr:amidase [Candidatus Aminicenantes bacterium]